MTRRHIYCVILLSDPKLLEPLLSFECRAPSEFASSVITLLNKRRGKILDMSSEEGMITVKAEMPVSESFGIADELCSSTQGRAFWTTQFSRWVPVSEQMQAETIKIRERRGLSPTPRKPEEYFESE
jgi:elongation factor 2